MEGWLFWSAGMLILIAIACTPMIDRSKRVEQPTNTFYQGGYKSND